MLSSDSSPRAAGDTWPAWRITMQKASVSALSSARLEGCPRSVPCCRPAAGGHRVESTDFSLQSPHSLGQAAPGPRLGFPMGKGTTFSRSARSLGEPVHCWPRAGLLRGCRVARSKGRSHVHAEGNVSRGGAVRPQITGSRGRTGRRQQHPMLMGVLRVPAALLLGPRWRRNRSLVPPEAGEQEPGSWCGRQAGGPQTENRHIPPQFRFWVFTQMKWKSVFKEVCAPRLQQQESQRPRRRGGEHPRCPPAGEGHTAGSVHALDTTRP